MRAAVAVLGLAGCNLLFEAKPDESLVDAPPSISMPCDPATPFGAGEPIDAEGRSVEAARFTREENLAYLSLCPVQAGAVDKTRCDLYVSAFDADKPVIAALAMQGVNSGCYDAYPTISGDKQHIVFASTGTPKVGTTCGQLKIWIASKQDSTFDNPSFTLFAGVPPNRCGNEPYVVGDGQQSLYFSTVPCGGGVSDLRVARGTPPTYDGLGVEVQGVNSSDDEFAPVVSEDELEMFFARGSAQMQRLDIFHARRGAPADAFASPVKQVALSAPGISWPVWLSPDACRLYYIHKTADASVATLFVSRRAK